MLLSTMNKLSIFTRVPLVMLPMLMSPVRTKLKPTLRYRYNDYTHDPLSKCNCTPPYSAENAISARCDLNPASGKYPFNALGHRQHGGTDAKVSHTHS